MGEVGVHVCVWRETRRGRRGSAGISAGPAGGVGGWSQWCHPVGGVWVGTSYSGRGDVLRAMVWKPRAVYGRV